jgi:hypothetical protein
MGRARGWRWTTIPAMAALLVVAGVLVTAPAGPGARAGAAAVAAPAARLDLAGPSGPVGSARCPPPPALPPGATAVRTGGPGRPVGTVAALTGPDGRPVAVGARCTWRAAWLASTTAGPDGKSVTYTAGTNVHMTLGTSYSFGVHADGVDCTGTGKVLNGLGGGGAQATLVSTYCNTSTVFATGLGYVQVVGSTYVSGTLERLTHFSTPVTTSFVSGHDVFYGSFQFCSEDPVGQTTHFACVYWSGGPFD